jgi:protein O-GlcNAc transferase
MININKSIQSAYAYFQAGNFKQAEILCRKVLEKESANVDVLNFIGVIHFQNNNFDSAMRYFKKALKYKQDFVDAHYNLANALKITGDIDEAVAHYEKAVQLNPNYVNAYNNLGTIYQDKNKLDKALSYFQKAITLNANHADAQFNIGNIFRENNQIDKAITHYEKSIRINPNFAGAYNNLGSVYIKKREIDKAILYFEKALKLDPNLAGVYSNLGCAFLEKGQHDEAVIVFCKKALEINPDLAEAYSLLAYEMQHMCNWQEFEALTLKLDRLTRKALDAGTKPAETPFMSITRNAAPLLNLAIAKSWSHDIEKMMSHMNIHFLFDNRRTSKTKIVIGYLSNRFGNTATANLMLSLFGLHDRDNFEIYCYSYGKNDGSYYRARIEKDSDKFIDIYSLSDEASAMRINEDQVDILVDLKGHTKDSRFEICALRPAPVQVSYLGFAGTTGADFIDYIITDKIVTPEEHSQYYSEKCVYMPHCYLVNDHTQPISEKEWKKADCGLPESCFVFCSFNQLYKIDPIMFDVWMRILKQVPESVLWLLCGNKTAEENLRREAEARGVKSERLIFAKLLPKDEHLSRLKLADLGLDTRIYNGHTTTSDALWAGVPVISLQGSHFASRVSSSILSALGVTELITYSIEEYEALAVRLALNALEVNEIRQKIGRNRAGEPLFDTPRFVRNLETAYKEMWKIFLSGDVPREIEVLER